MDFYFSEELQTAADGFRRIREKIVSIAEALSVVHSRGVVLRDLTRSNVMFTAAGQVKFIDLEFAHEIGVDDRWVKGGHPDMHRRNSVRRGDRPCKRITMRWVC